ncbi:MAG: hypothetical protein NC212_07860 [Staphylococcus sp.]|nr:hypothetical protein [Staphylococcus sp.]
MKNLLFPHCFQPIGWILFIPSLIAGTLALYSELPLAGRAETIVNDLIIIGVALGSLFIVCSKTRTEDEMVQSIRLASLLNSLYTYVVILIMCTVLLNGVEFLMFAIIDLALLPIIFVCIFRLEMQRYNKMTEDEE